MKTNIICLWYALTVAKLSCPHNKFFFKNMYIYIIIYIIMQNKTCSYYGTHNIQTLMHTYTLKEYTEILLL